MIRRDIPATRDAQAQWALISQIEHARVSGELAEHWGAAPFEPLVPRDELLPAIFHHDDGWHAWEPHPDVNAAGEPRAFTEMETADAVRIWSASIDAAAALGPLAGYVVAGHFCALAHRASAWKRKDPHWPEAEAFLDRYETLGRQWLASWQATNPRQNTLALAERGLAELQFFDAWSLWFCCAEASDAERLPTPAGQDLELIPQNPRRIVLDPWPLTVPRLNLEVPARLVVARPYASAAELSLAPSQTVRLAWELVPQPPQI